MAAAFFGGAFLGGVFFLGAGRSTFAAALVLGLLVFERAFLGAGFSASARAGDAVFSSFSAPAFFTGAFFEPTVFFLAAGAFFAEAVACFFFAAASFAFLLTID